MSETTQVGVPESEREVEMSDGTSSVAFPPERQDRLPSDDAVDAGQPQREEIRLDVIFDILKNQRRRHVLSYLRENETTTLSDLAEHVAALENGKDVKSLTSSERKRVYVGLYQCHLPRMSDAGVIDFDSDRGRIDLNEMATQLEQYLDIGASTARPWPLYHLALALVGAGTYGLSALLFGPQAIPTIIVAPVLILAVSISAIVEFQSRSSTDE